MMYSLGVLWAVRVPLSWYEETHLCLLYFGTAGWIGVLGACRSQTPIENCHAYELTHTVVSTHIFYGQKVQAITDIL